MIKLVWEKSQHPEAIEEDEQSQHIPGIGWVFLHGTTAFIQEFHGDKKTSFRNIQGTEDSVVKKEYERIVNNLIKKKKINIVEKIQESEFNWKPILNIGEYLEILNNNGDRIFRCHYVKDHRWYTTFYSMADENPQRCGNGYFASKIEAKDACERCYSEYLEQYNTAKKDRKARKTRDAMTIAMLIKEMASKDPENDIFNVIYELLTPQQQETVFRLGID